MKKLRIGPELELPVDWIMLATVVYGARGSGKTCFGRRAAEEAHERGQRFCAVDLKGDWYGLKSSADGKRPGLPVVIFGGDHADLPLEENAGAFVAETVATMAQSTVIDLENLSKGKQVRFLAAFFDRLYDANRETLLLLLDEAQRYAPQGRTFDPEHAKCLGAVEDLVKLGRKHGIGPVLFTQRGSGLNKEVSELCDMLVAFRTPGPLDQGRVKDWLDANTTKEQRDAVMGRLSGLPTGTAVFASGHPDLKVFGVYKVNRPETFDSSATPKPGQKRAEPKILAEPELEVLRERMAEAIERVKADDPRELKKRIAELERLLRDHKPEKTIETRVVERPVFDEKMVAAVADTCFEAIDEVRVKLGMAQATIERQFGIYREACRSAVALGEKGVAAAYRERVQQRPVVVTRPESTVQKVNKIVTRESATVDRMVTKSNGASKLTGPETRILTAMAQREPGPFESVEQLALFVGYHPRSKGFQNSLSALRGRGLVKGVEATQDGLDALGAFEELPTGEALVDWYCENKLAPVQAKILRLIAGDCDGLPVEQLAAHAGYHPRSKGFQNTLSRLRGLGLVEGTSLASDLR